MSIDAFVLRYQIEGLPFAAQFLASGDFDIETLKIISQELDLSPNKPKNELIQQIALLAGEYKQERALGAIIGQLIARKKGWASVKTGRISQFPQCSDPCSMIYSEGQEGWYGPITCQFDQPETYWYIRQKNIVHWEISDTDNQVHPFDIRWLIFARVQRDVISLHWRGFSLANTEEDATKRNSQFDYWRYIPEFFDEIQELTNAHIDYVNLHDLILQNWWDLYRDNQEYNWIDRRIRAESSGVALNAHAGAVYEIEAGGIRHLANTIRRSVERELVEKYRYGLPEPDKFDEVILRTLIREYGTLSYEFSLDREAEVVFRAHAYFGQKQLADSPDRFPHLRLHVTHCSDVLQLEFILHFLRNGRLPNADYQPEQLSLFG